MAIAKSLSSVLKPVNSFVNGRTRGPLIWLRWRKQIFQGNNCNSCLNIWHVSKSLVISKNSIRSNLRLTLFLDQRFLSPWWRPYVPSKRQFLQEPHGGTSQKTPFFIDTAVKISNLTYTAYWQGHKKNRKEFSKSLVPIMEVKNEITFRSQNVLCV
jgi:hypothetical protein